MALPDATLMRLKAATRDLVTASGGLTRAAEIAGVSDSTVSRWQTPHHGDVIPLTAALALEAECRWPAVTAAMAAMNGRALAEAERIDREAADVERAAARLRGDLAGMRAPRGRSGGRATGGAA